MPLSNEDIARLFENLGVLLELKGDSVFKIRAYQRAARTISHLSFPLAQAVEDGTDLKQIPGIGKAISGKIHELLQTGRVSTYERRIAEFLTYIRTPKPDRAKVFQAAQTGAC